MNIPADLLISRIRTYIDMRGISMEDFSESMGYHRDAVRVRIHNYGDFSFNMTDRIFCKLGDPLGFWQSEEFKSYYDAEFERECAYEKCDVRFLPHHEHQKYCSRKCKKSRARDRYNTRHAQQRRLWNANRMRAARAREKAEATPEELEYKRMRNRLYKRKWRQRRREAVAA